MTSKQKKLRPGRLLLSCLCGLMVLVLLVLLGGKLWFSLPISAYYRASEAAFEIPGISSGFVPQGMAYAADTDRLLLTGYMTDHSASPIYVVDYSTGKLEKRVTLRLEDGTLCTAHNGGLTVHNGYVYVCDSHSPSLRVFSLADLGAAADQSELREVGRVMLENGGDSIGPAFVEAGPDGLVVGEFYIAKQYETPVSHYVEDHHALAVLLPYDDSPTGVSETPVLAYSLPDLAQGMCFDDQGLMYISESWGTSFSTIEVFRPGEPTGEIDVLGVRVPMTMLGDANRISAVKAAPMSEEIVILQDQLYINCESASMKYLFGRLNGAERIFRTDLSYFKGE